jgi:hypothetical protein
MKISNIALVLLPLILSVSAQGAESRVKGEALRIPDNNEETAEPPKLRHLKKHKDYCNSFNPWCPYGCKYEV